MDDKKTWSQDISVEAITAFEKVATDLPGHKYQILEAMIYTFATLPRSAQVMALSGRYTVRQLLRIADLMESGASVESDLRTVEALTEETEHKPAGKRRVSGESR